MHCVFFQAFSYPKSHFYSLVPQAPMGQRGRFSQGFEVAFKTTSSYFKIFWRREASHQGSSKGGQSSVIDLHLQAVFCIW